MAKTLKTMTAAECSSERSRHRVAIGHLVLQRMRPDTGADAKVEIDAKLLKLRRRIVRLDRRIKQIADRNALTGKDVPWQPMPVIGGAS